MKPALGLIAAAALVAGCHRPHADQPNPGADSDAQAATANKAIADIQAAEAASQGPAPIIPSIVHHDEDRSAKKKAEAEETPPADDTTTVPVEGNQAQ